MSGRADFAPAVLGDDWLRCRVCMYVFIYAPSMLMPGTASTNFDLVYVVVFFRGWLGVS